MNYHLQHGVLKLQSVPWAALFHGGAGPADSGQTEQAGQALNNVGALLRNAPQGEVLKTEGIDFDDSQAAAVALKAVTFMEQTPVLNAGFGAALQGDGRARLSAAFMESRRQKFSAIMNVEDVLHPVELAYFLQGRRFCVLDTHGSKNLAWELKVPPAELISFKRFDKWVEQKRKTLKNHPEWGSTGTVGCVSVSQDGELAAATSTGGVGNETPGRIGDTPTVAGNYCDKTTAVSCTGRGEDIVNSAFASRVALRVHDGLRLADALGRSLSEAATQSQQLGAIALSLNGANIDWALGHTTPSFLWEHTTPSETEMFQIDQSAD